MASPTSFEDYLEEESQRYMTSDYTGYQPTTGTTDPVMTAPAPTTSVAPTPTPTDQPISTDPYATGDAYSTGLGARYEQAWTPPAPVPAPPSNPSQGALETGRYTAQQYAQGNVHSTSQTSSGQLHDEGLETNPYAWSPYLAQRAGPPPPSGPVPPYEPDPMITGEAVRRPPPTRPLTPDTSTHIYHPGQDHRYPSRRERPEPLPVYRPPDLRPPELMVTYWDGRREPLSVYLSRPDQFREPLWGEPRVNRDGTLTAGAFFFRPRHERNLFIDWPTVYEPSEDVSPVPWPEPYDEGRLPPHPEW